MVKMTSVCAETKEERGKLIYNRPGPAVTGWMSMNTIYDSV